MTSANSGPGQFYSETEVINNILCMHINIYVVCLKAWGFKVQRSAFNVKTKKQQLRFFLLRPTIFFYMINKISMFQNNFWLTSSKAGNPKSQGFSRDFGQKKTHFRAAFEKVSEAGVCPVYPACPGIFLSFYRGETFCCLTGSIQWEALRTKMGTVPKPGTVPVLSRHCSFLIRLLL